MMFYMMVFLHFMKEQSFFIQAHVVTGMPIKNLAKFESQLRVRREGFLGILMITGIFSTFTIFV